MIRGDGAGDGRLVEGNTNGDEGRETRLRFSSGLNSEQSLEENRRFLHGEIGKKSDGASGSGEEAGEWSGDGYAKAARSTDVGLDSSIDIVLVLGLVGENGLEYRLMAFASIAANSMLSVDDMFVGCLSVSVGLSK